MKELIEQKAKELFCKYYQQDYNFDMEAFRSTDNYDRWIALARHCLLAELKGQVCAMEKTKALFALNDKTLHSFKVVNTNIEKLNRQIKELENKTP